MLGCVALRSWPPPLAGSDSVDSILEPEPTPERKQMVHDMLETANELSELGVPWKPATFSMMIRGFAAACEWDQAFALVARLRQADRALRSADRSGGGAARPQAAVRAPVENGGLTRRIFNPLIISLTAVFQRDPRDPEAIRRLEDAVGLHWEYMYEYGYTPDPRVVAGLFQAAAVDLGDRGNPAAAHAYQVLQWYTDAHRESTQTPDHMPWTGTVEEPAFTAISTFLQFDRGQPESRRLRGRDGSAPRRWDWRVRIARIDPETARCSSCSERVPPIALAPAEQQFLCDALRTSIVEHEAPVRRDYLGVLRHEKRRGGGATAGRSPPPAGAPRGSPRWLSWKLGSRAVTARWSSTG